MFGLASIKFVLSHPLSKGRKVVGLLRWLGWQLGSRLVPGSVIVDYVDNAKLIVSPGMTGATGNVYVGLHEFEDMAFVLHALKPEDLFLDVGANIGTYTTLAAAAVGASCVCVEPAAAAYQSLIMNVRINGVKDRVDSQQVALGQSRGKLRFTDFLDTTNHVAHDGEQAKRLVEVPTVTMDELMGGRVPAIIKIDVEGYETSVLAGGVKTLTDPGVLAVILELEGAGVRYGFDDRRVHELMCQYGFSAFDYEPFKRILVPRTSPRTRGNTLYLRNVDVVRSRIARSKTYALGTGASI